MYTLTNYSKSFFYFQELFYCVAIYVTRIVVVLHCMAKELKTMLIDDV